MKTICMYLPQFHRVPENDLWWGEGFTEWTAVKAATPLYDNHDQPKAPLNDFYYNLLDKDVMEWQADLMHRYGIYGQCFYQYYFKNGKKILEKPAENLLKWKDIDMPFCFDWANMSWTRTWSNIQKGNSWADKFEKDAKCNTFSVLLDQKYGREEEWKAHFEYVLPFFRDERYIKYHNKPVFLIHYPEIMPCINQFIDYWRKIAVSHGFDGMYFIGVNCSNLKLGLDAFLWLAPHYFWQLNCENRTLFFDYKTVWDNIDNSLPIPEVKTYLGGMANCDDTPRRGESGVILQDFSIDLFEKGMEKLYQKSKKLENEFVFINAWNEWGEGMYLEPDQKYGYQYLESVKRAQTKAEMGEDDFIYEKDDHEEEVDDNIKKWQESYEVVKRNHDCFDRWLALLENNVNISDYLKKYNVQTVAIYGFGYLGKHLITQIERSGIKIEYLIDRMAATLRHPQYKIFTLENPLPKVDAVVITPIVPFYEIYEELKKKVDARIFSIEEMIFESK